MCDIHCGQLHAVINARRLKRVVFGNVNLLFFTLSLCEPYRVYLVSVHTSLADRYDVKMLQ